MKERNVRSKESIYVLLHAMFVVKCVCCFSIEAQEWGKYAFCLFSTRFFLFLSAFFFQCEMHGGRASILYTRFLLQSNCFAMLYAPTHFDTHFNANLNVEKQWKLRVSENNFQSIRKEIECFCLTFQYRTHNQNAYLLVIKSKTNGFPSASFKSILLIEAFYFEFKRHLKVFEKIFLKNQNR